MLFERLFRAIVESKGRLFWLLVAVAACVCAVAVVADSIGLTVRFFQPLFIWDNWMTVRDFKAFKEGTYRLADLFSQHNEHRLAVPRLIFLLDFVAGRGLNIVNIAAVWAIQALEAALLVVMAARLSRGPVLAIIAAAIVGLLFSFGQDENLTAGFQVQFVGVYAAATAACLAAASAMQPDASQRRRLAAMACALGAATVATYMMSNGLLSALIMVGLAVGLRAGKAIVATTILFAAAVLFAYLHGGHFGGGAPPLSMSLPQRVVATASYFLIYVGNVAGAYGVVVAGVFGFVGIALALAAFFRLVRRQETDAVHAALFGVMAFVTGTAAVTALGRVGFGLPQALSSRYMTPSGVFWAAQVVYWGSFARVPQGRRLPQAALLVLAAATMIVAVARHRAERPMAQWSFMAANLGTDMLLSGVVAPDVMKTIYPDASTVERLAPFLAREKLNVFAWPEASWRGKRLADVVPARDDSRCAVVLDKSTRLGAGGDVAVEGWAWDKRRRRSVARIVLVGPDQTIVGFGSGDWWRPDFRSLPFVENAEPGWKGFAKGGAADAIRPYAILDHGRVACGGG